MSLNAEPTRIERVGPAGLKVSWADGHQSLYTWEQLRAACPCAACLPAKPDSKGVQPLEIKPVGRYAMAVRWNDGHTTGIFSYDYLRSICGCEECKPDQMTEG